MSRSTSPSRDVSDLTVERENSANAPIQGLEEENANLRKQLRQVEGEHKTTKALLEQKIELLENQITGFQERESSLKKMNETIMLALNDMNGKDLNFSGNKAAKELELATVHHNKEMQEYRTRTNDFIKNLENENKKLREGMNENEMRVKELTLHFEKAQLGFNQAVNDLDQEKSVLESKVKRLEEERLQHRELSDYEILVKTNELKMGNEREKEEHRKDLQKIKETYDKSIQELKLTFENERRVMETKMEKMQEYMSKDGNKKETMTTDLQSKYHKEIQQLKDIINQMKTDHAKETEGLKAQCDQANEKAEKVDAQSKKLKTALKNSQALQEQNSKQLKEKLDKAKSVMEHGESLIEENKKYKQKIVDLKAQIKKLEASEQNLKGMMQEKENRSNEDIKKQQEQKKLSQSMLNSQTLQSQQIKSRRQSGALAVLPLDENTAFGSRNYPSILSSSTIPTEMQSNQISQFSPPPKEDMIEPIVIRTSISQRNERSVSPLSGSINASKLPPSRTPDINERKSIQHREEKGTTNTPNITNRKTPLETSFADHGFNVEDALRTDTSRVERTKPSAEKLANVESMPINYNEFIKRSQRSKKQTDKPEDELEKSTNREPIQNDHSDDMAHQLFFTTAQDENQPLFGTSHFVFEGTQDLQDDQEREITPIKRGEEDRRDKKRERPITDDLDFEKKILGFNHDIDMEDIVELGEVSRLSTNYNHRRGSLTKSYNMREDMDTRPSLMNPLHSVYDSTNIHDLFQDHQASIDLLSAHPKSAVDREREKDKEKVFSSRCSLNVSASNRGNGSRQKIEGRLKDLEWKLKEMELKNQGLRVEKDKVQFEFEKLMVELKEKRAESEGMKKNTNEPWDEKKEEREVALKNEIKFLINKLLKVKNKLEKQSEELNVTKSSNILGQSQLNYSMSSYQPQGKKDYSKEYGNLGSGLNNIVLTSQIKERENWNPAHQNPQILQRSINSESWNGASVLNTSGSKLENYRVSERGSTKSSLGVAIENFAKNVRSKSNARYDHNRESQNQSNISLNYGAQKQIESISATTRTHRTKGPILPRPEDLGTGINREVLKPLTSQNYEISNTGSVNFDNNSSYLYQRKYPR